MPTKNSSETSKADAHHCSTVCPSISSSLQSFLAWLPSCPNFDPPDNTLPWVQLILPFLNLLSRLPCQSHYQINPTICLLSSSSWAAKSYWENWITTLIDSAANVWFPMSSELSVLLSSLITHPHLGWSSHSTQQLFPTHPPPIPQIHPHPPHTQYMISPPTAGNIEAIKYETLQWPPLHLQIYLYIYTGATFCTSKEELLFFCPFDLLSPRLPTSAKILFHQCAFSLLFNL